jgi:hypothetical protein
MHILVQDEIQKNCTPDAVERSLMTIHDTYHTSRKGPSVEFHQYRLLAPTSCKTVSTTFFFNAQYITFNFKQANKHKDLYKICITIPNFTSQATSVQLSFLKEEHANVLSAVTILSAF